MALDALDFAGARLIVFLTATLLGQKLGAQRTVSAAAAKLAGTINVADSMSQLSLHEHWPKKER